MANLQRAIELAIQAHADQEDDGEPYLLHPMRVMLSLGDHASEQERIVAILHDSVERGGLAFDTLVKAGFSKRVVRAIQLLTHDKAKTSYAGYVTNLKPDPIARAVKLADLRDNAKLEHVSVRPKKWDKDAKRIQRYALSYKFLTDQLSEADFRRLMKAAE